MSAWVTGSAGLPSGRGARSSSASAAGRAADEVIFLCAVAQRSSVTDRKGLRMPYVYKFISLAVMCCDVPEGSGVLVWSPAGGWRSVALVLKFLAVWYDTSRSATTTAIILQLSVVCCTINTVCYYYYCCFYQ